MVALSRYHLADKSFKMIAQAGVGSRPSSYLRGKCAICDAGQGIDE
jgi:hypothetical protein